MASLVSSAGFISTHLSFHALNAIHAFKRDQVSSPSSTSGRLENTAEAQTRSERRNSKLSSRKHKRSMSASSIEVSPSVSSLSLSAVAGVAGASSSSTNALAVALSAPAHAHAHTEVNRADVAESYTLSPRATPSLEAAERAHASSHSSTRGDAEAGTKSPGTQNLSPTSVAGAGSTPYPSPGASFSSEGSLNLETPPQEMAPLYSKQQAQALSEFKSPTASRASSRSEPVAVTTKRPVHKSRRHKAVARSSFIDRHSAKTEISGISNAVFTFVAFASILQPILNYLDNGYFFDSTLMKSMSEHLLPLTGSVLIIFVYSFSAWLLRYMMLLNVATWKLMFVQNIVEIGLFVAGGYITFSSGWPLIQSAAFTFELLVLFMKMHSFVMVNRKMFDEYRAYQSTLSELSATSYQTSQPEAPPRISALPSPLAGPSDSSRVSKVVRTRRHSSSSVLHEAVLRQRHQAKAESVSATETTTEAFSIERRKSVSSSSSSFATTSSPVSSSWPHPHQRPPSPPPAPISIAQLHVESTITTTATKSYERSSSCVSAAATLNVPFQNGRQKLYSPSTLTSTPFHSANRGAATPMPDDMQAPPDPHSVTFASWVYFMFAPTLVFELDYPLTSRVRLGYMLNKLAAGAGAFWACYLVVINLMFPAFEMSATINIVELWVRMIIPTFLMWLLLFFVVFEVVLNCIAEVTRFADREFYVDWWNSTTFDEFARKWNRPVHKFLLKHVYVELIQSWGVTKMQASLATFLISAVLHEIALMMCFRMFYPVLFGYMLIEIAFINMLRRMRNSTFGNVFFWSMMIIGIPMVVVAYGRRYFLLNVADPSVFASLPY